MLFECQSPSAEVTEQCVEFSQYLQQSLNEWSKPAYLTDAALKTCLKSNVLLNYTTLTVCKLKFHLPQKFHNLGDPLSI